jgi:hypothetical protein
MSSELGRAFSRLSGRSRWRAAAVTVAVVAGGLGGTAAIASQATAATTAPGTLALIRPVVTAGDTADNFTFVYLPPQGERDDSVLGTITIDIPVGFTEPQNTNSTGPGYVQASGGGGCSQFQITRLTPGSAGSTAVTIAVNCLSEAGSANLTYSNVSVPTTAGSYPLDASFTPSASSGSTPFDISPVTVSPGPAVELSVSPRESTVMPGGKQTYVVTGLDIYGNSVPVEATLIFRSLGGTCTGYTCTAPIEVGQYSVEVTSGSLGDWATLNVA